ncbi:MAG: MauE/DoxX family redox-associated membrane protein [Sandaracinaceae bacterium]
METFRTVLRWLLALAFIGAGINHFVNPDFYVQIMPPYLPLHLELVWLSGVAEVLLGVAVLVPKTRRLAGWGLVALLVAVFPANLHMALHPEDFPDAPAWGLYLRLPFQLLFIAWSLWVTRGPKPEASPPAWE